MLLERMHNESTRLPALRAVDMVARSPAGVDLSSITVQAALDLASFLRQASRELKQQSLVRSVGFAAALLTIARAGGWGVGR